MTTLQALNVEEYFLSKHPLSGLDGAGIMLQMLRRQFHSFLRTTANIMPKVGGVMIPSCYLFFLLPLLLFPHPLLLLSSGVCSLFFSLPLSRCLLPPSLLSSSLPSPYLPHPLPFSSSQSARQCSRRPCSVTTCSSSLKITPFSSKATSSPTSARPCPSLKSPHWMGRTAGACGTG